jgi:hypothetical protein
MISISIRVGELEVNVQSTDSHPDHLTDMNNRAISAFKSALETAHTLNASIYGDEFADYPDEE